jgi:hypothetical protein
MANHRKTKRAPLDVYLNKFVGGVPHLSRASDISAEGVSLARLLEPEQGGKRVGLQFQLPGSEEIIYAEGEVVRDWVNAKQETRSGVKFTLLTDRHRKMIDRYVSGFSRDSEG